MIEFLDSHFPILQVIIPLFGALLSIVLCSLSFARVIAFVSMSSCVMLNLYSLFSMNGEVRYVIGGFLSPYGIEYRLDNLNQPVVSFISIALLFTISLKEHMARELERYITESKAHLLYSLLLLVYSGLAGIISTNDLFNLYVFLEISSLASYALLSQGQDRRSMIGALDYLILGTLGASFILIGIGIIFSVTGSLNIDDIYLRLKEIYGSKFLSLGIFLFILGCLLKIALMPLHFWMISAYSFASPILLTFLSGVSSVVGFYILLRFIYFAIDYDMVYGNYFGVIIKYLSLASIIIGSYFALKADSLRRIILYSATAQMGYACLLLSYPSPEMVSVALSCIIADALTKITLFVAIPIKLQKPEEEKLSFPSMRASITKRCFMFLRGLFFVDPRLRGDDKMGCGGDGKIGCGDGKIECAVTFFIILIFTLLSNASFPLTIGFINKINLLIEMLNNDEYISFAVVIIASTLSLNYNYRIFRIFYDSHFEIGVKETVQIAIPAFASLIFLCYNNVFLEFFANFFMNIMNG